MYVVKPEVQLLELLSEAPGPQCKITNKILPYSIYNTGVLLCGRGDFWSPQAPAAIVVATSAPHTAMPMGARIPQYGQHQII